MPGMYTSKYSGYEIDMAIMNALMFNPDENGWIKISSSESVPVDVNTIISTGNFIIEYFINGPTALNGVRPLNVSVHDDNGTLRQYITYLDNVYYRDYDYSTGLYAEEWVGKKTTNYIYIGETPTSPEKNTLRIIENANGNYTLTIFNGTEWKEVSTPDVMLGKVYDTENRQIDFFQYVDDVYQQMTSSAIGVNWKSEDVSALFKSKIACFKYLADTSDTALITFKDSSKMLYFDSLNMIEVDLPESFRNPQLIAFKNEDGSIADIYLYDTLGESRLIYRTDGLFTGWEYVDIRNISIWCDDIGSSVYVTPLRFYGLQTSPILDEYKSDEAYPWCYIKYSYEDIERYGIFRFKYGEGPTSIYTMDLEPWAADNIEEYCEGSLCGLRGSQFMYTAALSEPGDTDNYSIVEGLSTDAHTYSIDGESIIISKIYTRKTWTEDPDGGWYLAPCMRAEFREHSNDSFDIRKSFYDFTVNEYYVQYSNFKEFFDMYNGYAITNTGRVDVLNFIVDLENDEIEYVSSPLYQINTVGFIADAILYDTSSLKVIGHTENDTLTYTIFTSSQEDNLLGAVEDHITNVDIHFSKRDRDVLNSRATSELVETRFNKLEVEAKAYTDETFEDLASGVENTSIVFESLYNEMNQHISDEEIHITPEKVAKWDSKADGHHTHNLDGKVKIHARDIVAGKLNINRIPTGAKERITKVETLDDMLLLTSNDVQEGDRVAIKSTAVDNAYELYEVVDESALAIDDGSGNITPGTMAAFHECAAGSGVWIDWKNVDEKPTTVAGYGIIDTYTKEESDAVIDEKIKNATDLLEERYATYDLDELYETIHHTDDEISTIEDEMAAAIAISEKVNEQRVLYSDQLARISQMAEDMESMEEVITDLLAKFA